MMEIQPGLPWEADLFRPEDAPGVANLFLTVYGEGYPIRAFIEPDLLRTENAARRTVSSVARTSAGQIAGHNALFHSAPWEGIWESGAGLVHPAYRGAAHIFTKLVAHGQDVLKDMLRGQGVFGESVLNHVYSQRLCKNAGWVSQAVEVDLMPAEAYVKEGAAQGRVSNLVDFMTIRPRPHAVHLPPDLEEPLRFIYAEMDDQRTLIFTPAPPASDTRTRIKAQIFPFAQVARLAIHQAGADIVEAVAAQEAEAAAQGVTVFQAWLNLGHPGAGWAATALRQRGYFLGGVLPRWFDDDGLLLQRMTHRPNWEGMKLAFDRGKQIVALARADWERTQA
jgi:hypothetical protein